MGIRTRVGAWGAAMILAAICLAPASAFAESECSVDSDCGEHFVCEKSITACASPPVWCDAEDMNDCPPAPECEGANEMVGRCAPAPPGACDTAADCESGLVCVTYIYESCTDSAAPGCDSDGTICPEPDPEQQEECTTEREGLCLPKYMAPCEATADCGEGFECKAEEICSCSGSGPTNNQTGSDENNHSEPTEPECTCEPGEVKSCQLLAQECQENAECPGDFICASLPGGGASSAGSTCYDTPSGETVCEEFSGEEPVSYCLPADYERWLDAGIPGYGDSSESSSNNQSGDYDDDSGDGSNSGNGGNGHSGVPSDDGGGRELVSVDVDRSESGASPGDGNGDDGCGCASTGNSLPGSAVALFFALLGVTGLRRRSS